MFICKNRVEGVTEDLRSLYNDVCPSTIGHMTDFGFLKGLTPLFEDFHFVGNAVTVQLPDMDSIAIHKATEIAREGDVVLVTTSGNVERACLGELVAYAFMKKKVAAIIIDGAITDVRALRKMGIPIFSKGVSPLTTRSVGIEGAVNVPISISGVVINPGDLVVGDDDGVFVVSPEEAEFYGEKAIAKQNGEPLTKERLDNGEELSKINGNYKYFE